MYHAIFRPMYRRKALYAEVRPHLAQVFRALARPKESEVLEGRSQRDHVHLLLAMPPGYSVSCPTADRIQHGDPPNLVPTVSGFASFAETFGVIRLSSNIGGNKCLFDLGRKYWLVLFRRNYVVPITVGDFIRDFF